MLMTRNHSQVDLWSSSVNLAREKAAESPISDAREDHEGIACILIVTSNPIIKIIPFPYMGHISSFSWNPTFCLQKGTFFSHAVATLRGWCDQVI